MTIWKRLLSAMLTAALLAGPVACLAEGSEASQGLTVQDVEALGAKVYTRGDRVTFVEGSCVEAPIVDAEQAGALVQDMAALLGGDERTQFESWRTLSDTAGNRYYVFQQMYAGTTVSGGAVKVITDAQGNMLGLVSSVERDLPDVQQAEGIGAEQAEALVGEHMLQVDNVEADLLQSHTQKVILPVNLELDPDLEEEKEESRYVWVVYSTNPSGSVSRGSDLPYLAHYVNMDGTYLYSLPTIIPGDEVGTAGYDAAYVFEFMEPAEYDGEVNFSDGTQKHINVTLMRDSRTGIYYLGNIERRIVVADCYEFLYNNGSVVLEHSADNTGWDDTCLLALYNYCRAWDYYREIGWEGGDGLGTPILILKDYCDKNHEPIDNAAYAGKYYGWQLFLSSSANDYSQALDVLAHEFTHCVTGSVMTYNAYMNDYGAINEAMSDIQGNICDEMYLDEGEEEDTLWILGEESTSPVRSMSTPHDYSQPQYAWDLYYTPNVQTPTDLNDRGGVHTNSSLLNNIAYRLIREGGMTLEEARAYWFAVDCSMVPGTDYAQLSRLMPWVMKNLGLEAYIEALETAMDATRIRTDEMPDTFDDDRALVTLTLPDEERFTDGNWMLIILSLNVDLLKQRIIDMQEEGGEYAGAVDELKQALGLSEEGLTEEGLNKLIEMFTNWMNGEEGTEEPDVSMFKDLGEWYRKYLSDVLFYGTGAAGQDGRTVRMVCRPGLTLPLLVKLEFETGTMKLKTLGAAAYTFGSWFDLTGLIADVDSADAGAASDGPVDLDALGLGWLDLGALTEKLEEAPTEESEQEMTAEEMQQAIEEIMEMAQQFSWLKDLIFTELKGAQTNEIPSTGLEQVTLLEGEAFQSLFEGLGDESTALEETTEAQTPDSGIDLSGMTGEELQILRDRLEQEIEQRALAAQG